MKDHKEYIYEQLQNDEFAIEYLRESLKDDDICVFLLALDDFTKARNIGKTALAKQTGLSREPLYKALSDKGNPQFTTVRQILKALGFQLSVEHDVA